MREHPRPHWLAASAPDGAIRVRWDLAEAPHAVAKATLVVALRHMDPEGADDEAFWAGDLDNDLIRMSVVPEAGQVTAYAPADRVVQLTLVCRDAAGALTPAPRLSLAVEVVAGAQSGAKARVPVLEAPVPHAHGPAADIPLIFVEGPDAPDLEALAARVASQVKGEPVQAGGRATSGAFGAKQRWYLTRLGFTPPEGAGLKAVVRTSFIDAPTLASFLVSPPDDALDLPEGSDGLVDGLTPADSFAFYAVLAGPAPWRLLQLTPLPPPFEASAAPALLGDVAGRLEPAVKARVAALASPTPGEIQALKDIPPQLALLEAAAAVLPKGSEARRAVAALAGEPRY